MSVSPGSAGGETLTAADLAVRVDQLLSESPAGGGTVALRALEELYTSGCAPVLELEAEVLRLRRRGEAALRGRPAERLTQTELSTLAANATELEADLNELRQQLRHVRTAAEWLRERGIQGAP